MAAKEIGKNAANGLGFFSNENEEAHKMRREQEKLQTDNTQSTQFTQKTQETQNVVPENDNNDNLSASNTSNDAEKSQKTRTYRVNMAFDKDLKPFLKKISWQKHESVTQYLNDLVRREMEIYLSDENNKLADW